MISILYSRSDWLARSKAGAAGLRVGKRIETIAGVAGHVVYGPYLTLRPGRYCAVFGLEIDAAGPPASPGGEEGGRVVCVDVAWGAGENLAGSLEIKEGEFRSGEYSVEFEVAGEDWPKAEARVWTSGDYNFAVTSVNVKRLDVAPPLERPFDPSLYDWLLLGTPGPAGVREIEAIPGVEGHVIYGPYLTLPQGRYRAVFGVEVEGGGARMRVEGAVGRRAVYLDVVSGLGQTLLGSLEIKDGEFESGSYSVEFEIRGEDQANMEARVWTRGEYGFAVNALNVERLSEMPADAMPVDPGPYDWLGICHLGMAGTRKWDRIGTISGREGHVLYGPYLTLPQGRYRANFGFEAQEADLVAGVEEGKRAVYLDIVSEQGEVFLSSLEIGEGEFKSGNYAVEFEIGWEDQTQLLEARVWTSGKYCFAVTSVKLESIEDVPAAKNRNREIPKPEERAKEGYFGSHFPVRERHWVQALVVAWNCVGTGDILYAPVQFLGYFPKTLDYQLIDEESFPAIEWLILHKSMAAGIGLKTLNEVRQRLTPVFANEVFVIFSKNASAPGYVFDPVHLQTLWNRLEELERNSPRESLKKIAPSYAAVITTYNRPWALARSLPQIIKLGYPVVVVEDGSDPKYQEDYRKIEDQYEWALVSWIKLPRNRGVSCAINSGVSYLLADRSIEWISYFQDDVDVHPEIFEYLGRVQDRLERPLLAGRRPPEHPIVGEAEINGIHVLSYHSVPGQHLHAHKDYWRGVMPLPTFKVGLPKPHQGSNCDWWIGSWAPNSVCKTERKIVCVPRLVSTFAIEAKDSTWVNAQGADEGLLPDTGLRPEAAPKIISFCTTCANRLYQFRQTFAANLKVIMEDPNTEWIIFNSNSKDGLHEFMIDQLPALPPRVIYARDLTNHPWHKALAMNAAHRLASGDILFNLDCDNFIGRAVDAVRAYCIPDLQVVHLWSGMKFDGTYGRIAMDRELFHRLGGYDESFHPMGYHDCDMLDRTRAHGMKVLHIPSPSHLAIKNDKTESMSFYSGTAEDWDKWNKENQDRSRSNISNDRLVANEGKNWGQLELEIFRGKTDAI